MVGNICKTKFWFDMLPDDSALKDCFLPFSDFVYIEIYLVDLYMTMERQGSRVSVL